MGTLNNDLYHKLTARWVQLPTEIHQDNNLFRSSHTLAVVDDHAYIFGGETEPRVPVDNTLYIYNLLAKHWEPPVLASSQDPNDMPSPRVGAATAVIGHLIYLWGGRGGADMNPLPNELFRFDTLQRQWCKIRREPKGEEEEEEDGPPVARSYHAMTASDSHLYVFGGCPLSGRLNDLYSYNPLTNHWKALPLPANISPRGGSALTFYHPLNKLLLFGGFNGTTETNDLQVFDIEKKEWFQPQNLKEDLVVSPRSVHGFVSLPKNGLLVTLYGEHNPSTLGHLGAGKFLDDVWALRLESNNEKDKIEWYPVEILELGEGTSIANPSTNSTPLSNKPTPRGWFPAAAWDDKIILYGGLDGENKRLDDLWVLEFV
ncbi:hypothetical protein G9A89_014306 [Geosiphon pyriformis]|nr:hypothetical protein G9A89_014306 [Geosiphon pyriformis]